nr:MAG TPA: hypothetical protein [Caudoviricetes sp.]
MLILRFILFVICSNKHPYPLCNACKQGVVTLSKNFFFYFFLFFSQFSLIVKIINRGLLSFLFVYVYSLFGVC